MKIKNNNERYGWSGPFEAESFESLADEMAPIFKTWADEEIDKHRDRVFHGEADPDDEPSLDELIHEMREEFIDGLEEIIGG